MDISFSGAPDYMDRMVGFGNASHYIFDNLGKFGINCKVRDKNSKIGISFCQPFQYKFSKGQYRIGYTPWESDDFPFGWMQVMNSCDEMWATSPWVANLYSEKLNVVDSKEFANLVHEMGNGGANNLGRNFSESWKQNLSNSASKIKNDDQWKNTIGKETRLKDSIIKNDPIWREIIGKPSWEKAKQNQINTKNKQKWKKENSIECPYCHKIVDVGNYKRWHGIKCKKAIRINGKIW